LLDGADRSKRIALPQLSDTVVGCSLLVANRQMIWKVQNKMHSPGIEPGTSAWKADILPLNYECFKAISINTATLWA
jgi:hypothetical protein